MDSNTWGVLTTLLIDVSVAVFILLGWFLMRVLRGNGPANPRKISDQSNVLFLEDSLEQSHDYLNAVPVDMS